MQEARREIAEAEDSKAKNEAREKLADLRVIGKKQREMTEQLNQGAMEKLDDWWKQQGLPEKNRGDKNKLLGTICINKNIIKE